MHEYNLNNKGQGITWDEISGIHLFHTIGEDTVGSDEVKGVTDIVAYNGKVIVSCKDGVLRIF